MNDTAPALPGWYKTPNGPMWWTGTEWDPNIQPNRESQPPVYPVVLWTLLLGPIIGLIATALRASRARKINLPERSYWIAWAVSSVVNIFVVIIIIAMAASSSSQPSGLVPGSATADQICQTTVGDEIQNNVTGNDLNETVQSAETGSILKRLSINSARNRG